MSTWHQTDRAERQEAFGKINSTPQDFMGRTAMMHATVELPSRIEAREQPASLDDILSTVKVVYTMAACGPCGRAAMFHELTDPVVREQVTA